MTQAGSACAQATIGNVNDLIADLCVKCLQFGFMLTLLALSLLLDGPQLQLAAMQLLAQRCARHNGKASSAMCCR